MTKPQPTSSFEPIKAPGTVVAGTSLLEPSGPDVVLGWKASELAVPLAATASDLFGPRGLCLHPDGSLWVADTGHHRLLGWREVPTTDNAPADLVIGQANFTSEGRNGRGAVSAATLNVPTGVTEWRGGLAVADPWNHRVLIWRRPPDTNNQPADIVLGQASGEADLANRGAKRPQACTLHWPYGIAAVGDALVVCDTGNRRVLVWDDVDRSGQPADRVLGQIAFDSRDENAGGEVSALSMRWPHDVVSWQGRLAVADAGNNRIMLWSSGLPSENGAAADTLFGQSSFTACDHNMGAYYPSNRALNMPYALAVSGERLLVGDTANSRLVGWGVSSMAAEAERLTGQSDFASKGDNGWGVERRDSLCWPYGLAERDGLVGIADSGNNRVLLWRCAP